MITDKTLLLLIPPPPTRRRTLRLHHAKDIRPCPPDQAVLARARCQPIRPRATIEKILALLEARAPQAWLLQGDRGFSRKGPDAAQSSFYVSQPQLQVSGTLGLAGQRFQVSGSAWLDHEWSEALLHPEAEGWDWMGINLLDGGALTAFRLRRPDGSALWHGGSLRRPGQPDRIFGPDELRLTPGRRWTSPATGARYPVAWTLEWPEGTGSDRHTQRHTLRASLDAQELDSRGSTGNVYWEGLSELRDADGHLAGRGYLEMTGYTARLAL